MIKLHKTQPRFEYKMVIRGFDLEWARSLILTHPKAFFIRYPSRWINNIYFDTESLSSYRQNLSGISKREKIRFRWYGQSADNIKGHLELKCKENGLGWKIIQDINIAFHLTLTSWNRIIKTIGDQLSDYLKIRFNQSSIPIIINRYNRQYYEAKDGSCRITLDSSQVVYNQRLYSRPNLKFSAPFSNNIVVELKFLPDKKKELQSVTDNLPFLIDRNSKYVSGVSSY